MPKEIIEDDDSEVISLESDDQDLPELVDEHDLGSASKEPPRSEISPARDGAATKFSPPSRNSANQAGRDVATKTLKSLLDSVRKLDENDLPEKDYEQGERDIQGSTKVPFPKDLKNCRLKVVRNQRMGDEEESVAQFKLAEVHYHSGRYVRALKAACLAYEIAERQRDKAKAIRLAANAQLARGEVQTALHMVEAYQQLTSQTALSALALADVNLATRRPQQALKVAENALASCRDAEDKEGMALALQKLAKIEIELGRAFSLGGAMHAHRALLVAEEALGLLRELGHQKDECDILVVISQAHLMRHEYEDAHIFAKGASELCEKIAYARGAVSALHQLANIMLHAGEEPDMIVIVATQAVELAQHCGDWLGEISARQAVANAYVADGFKNSALEVLEPALNLARKLRNSSLIDSTLNAMDKIHGTDSDLGLKLLYEEADLAKEAGDAQRESAALVRLTVKQLALGNHESGLLLAEQAIEVARSARDQKAEAAALLTVARVHNDMHCRGIGVGAALDYTGKAKKLFQDIGAIMEAVTTAQFEADIHENLGHVEEILASYAEQGRMYRSIGWQDLEAAVCLALAQRLSSSVGHKEAMTACKQAVTLYRGAGDKEGEAAATLQLGKFQFAAKLNSIEVLRTARGARSLFRSLNDNSGEAQALVFMAEVNTSLIALSDALDSSRQALALCQEVGDKIVESKALRALANVHTISIQIKEEQGTAIEPQEMEDALMIVAESIAFHQAMGEDRLQAHALLQISTLHRLNHNAEAGLHAAAQVEAVAISLNDGRIQALAFLRKAEAFLALGQAVDALETASDAQELFVALQDDKSYKLAIEIMDKAAKAGVGDASSSPLTSSKRKVHREAVREKVKGLLDGPFFVVGSWNDWASFEELVAEEDVEEPTFCASVRVRRAPGHEEFQIVYNRDWTMRFHPAGGGKIEGPDNMHDVNWQVQVPPNCASVRIIWNPRGARSCEWRFVLRNGTEQGATTASKFGLNVNGTEQGATPISKFASVQKLLSRDKDKDSKPEGKMDANAQKLLGGRGQSAKLDTTPTRGTTSIGGVTLPRKSGQTLLQPGSVESGTLRSSFSESDETVGRIESAEQRRAQLLGAAPRKPASADVQLNSSLTETEEAITAKQVAAEQRRAALLTTAQGTGTQAWSQPDQEKRRAEARAAADQDALVAILKAVRGDWTLSERQVVVRKLAIIGIASPSALHKKLDEEGPRGINNLLREAGQKPLKEETLNHMQAYGRK